VTGVPKHRKRIWLAVAAVVFVSAILLWFWNDSQRSRVSVGFVRNTSFGKTIVLAVTNQFDFPITFVVYTQTPDGNGWFPGVPALQSNAPANSTVTFSIRAVSTNEWRPFVAYTEERFLARVRFRLDAMAYSNGWWRARDILRAEKLRGIANGPKMIGDTPAQSTR
jgi:hypothetical protein